MKINMKKWAEDLILSKETVAMPIMTYPGLSLVNKDIMDVITDGEAQAAAILALAEVYPSAAAVTIMDLSLEAQAFGSPVRFADDEVPSVTGRIVSDMDEAEALRVPAIGDGRTSVFIEAAKIVSEKISGKPAFGGEIGPFSLAGRLVDMTEVMVMAITDPEVVHVVLSKTTEFLIQYALANKAAGTNGIVIAEPAAGLLSPDMCEEFSSQYVKKIVEAVQDDNFMVILHNCGNTVPLVPSLLGTGARGFHFGNAVDMTDILPQIPSDILAFGNIDPAGTFKNGTPENMVKATRELLEKTRNYSNFVVSSGCDVPPGTPIENVEAFYSTVKDFNRGV
ncbi:MAG: uroporphyrinogen decarboxylase family protein [Bacillota bacterium]